MTKESIPPVERSVSVSWSPEAAFTRFTAEFGTWWPSRTHSIGGPRLKRVVFETQVGGRIFEEHVDGRRFAWGRVLEWDPPRRVRFTWHPSREPETAQDVEVRFVPEDTGTRVVLIATGWENWGPKARAARRGYDLGWKYVVNVFAGRRTVGMTLVDGIQAVLTLASWLRGGTAANIARARGEMTGD